MSAPSSLWLDAEPLILASGSMTRRDMLQKTGMGMGALSLAMFLGETSAQAAATPVTGPRTPLSPKQPHFKTKAKHVIHIFAGGGPSHVDTWDPKPSLAKYEDQTLPGLNGLAYPTPFKFEKKGKSGVEVSEIFPHLGDCVDHMTVIRSMWTDVPAHEPASKFMHTGSLQIPKPSLGSWVVYGLGTENQNMPGFISLGGKAEYRQAAFLPSLYQGVNVNYSANMPLNQVLLNIHNPFTSPERQREQLDLARKLNGIYSEKLHKEEQLEARIESFEMAFKMQTEATDAFDITKESSETREIEVVLDPLKLTSAGLTVADVSAALKAENRLEPVGRFTESGQQHLSLASGLWTSVDQIAAAPVLVKNGATIRISDLGTVKPGAPDKTVLITGNGKDAVSLSISQQIGANILTLKQGVDDAVTELTRSLPAGLHVTKVYDLA